LLLGTNSGIVWIDEFKIGTLKVENLNISLCLMPVLEFIIDIALIKDDVIKKKL